MNNKTQCNMNLGADCAFYLFIYKVSTLLRFKIQINNVAVINPWNGVQALRVDIQEANSTWCVHNKSFSQLWSAIVSEFNFKWKTSQIPASNFNIPVERVMFEPFEIFK